VKLMSEEWSKDGSVKKLSSNFPCDGGELRRVKAWSLSLDAKRKKKIVKTPSWKTLPSSFFFRFNHICHYTRPISNSAYRPPFTVLSAMIASRSVLRHVAARQIRNSPVRAASVWANVQQGPPVSSVDAVRWNGGLSSTGCESNLSPGC